MTDQASDIDTGTLERQMEPVPGEASPAHGRAAARAIHRADIDERVVVDVFRHHRYLEAVVAIPNDTRPSVRAWIRQRIHAGLRQYDRDATLITVTLTDLD
ncbi:MAG: hypothetical protein AAGA99_15120 [Actinomycetota bacterium]